MGWHSDQRGRTIGRILHTLEVYCESNHRLFETATVGESEIKYRNHILARFDWHHQGNDAKDLPLQKLDNDDTPFLSFDHHCPSINSPDLVARFERAQYILRPFLDDRYIVSHANYAVQEIRKILSFEEALAIKHLRDRLKGEWNDVTVKEETVKSIQNMVAIQSEFIPESEGRQKFIDSWQHLAMCAIYEI